MNMVGSILFASLVGASVVVAQEPGTYLLRREIGIRNVQQFPAAVFFAVVRDVDSSEIIDSLVFRPASPTLLRRHYPGALIHFHWARRSDLRGLCRTFESLDDCIYSNAELAADSSLSRRLETVLENTDTWLPESDPIRILRTDYAVAVNFNGPPALVLYTAKETFGYNDGSPIRIVTYRKP